MTILRDELSSIRQTLNKTRFVLRVSGKRGKRKNVVHTNRSQKINVNATNEGSARTGGTGENYHN
jgi:hypothetical protein